MSQPPIELAGRHRSTVYRELARNSGLDGYCARAAHRQAGVDAARPKTPKLAGDAVLAADVAEGLKQGWSPHAISADLHARGLPTVCAETIYRACYANHPDSGLKADSWKELPRGRRRRKRRSRCEAAKRSVLGDYKPLSQRPRAAEERSEAGHSEGDLMIGANNASAVAALVERCSRLTLVVPLLNGYSADNTAAAAAVTAVLLRQPAGMVRTLTWDQGSKMARWEDIEANLGIQVFFCEPRSPWQRPSNEQTNGLLRRWLPNRTNLNICPIQLALIQDSLNHMPPQTPQLETRPTHLHYTQSQPPIELAVGNQRHHNHNQSMTAAHREPRHKEKYDNTNRTVRNI